jgi:hypothetical protein
VVSFESVVKWLHHELNEVASGRNHEFLRPWWSSAPDVQTGVALELPTHSLVRINVGERLKKVWGPSPYCGGSYGRGRDRLGGRHGRIVLFVICGSSVVTKGHLRRAMGTYVQWKMKSSDVLYVLMMWLERILRACRPAWRCKFMHETTCGPQARGPRKGVPLKCNRR